MVLGENRNSAYKKNERLSSPPFRGNKEWNGYYFGDRECASIMRRAICHHRQSALAWIAGHFVLEKGRLLENNWLS